MPTTTRNEVMEVLKKSGPMTTRQLKERFHLIPETEENRSGVWRLSQAVAELYNQRYINKQFVNDWSQVKVFSVA
jgi:hypothetical protein